MKLWRLDAMHEAEDAEGAFCLFFRGRPEARLKEAFLANNGWMTDVYLEDLGPLDPWATARLTQNLWPLASIDTIRELLRVQRRQEELKQRGGAKLEGAVR